MRTPKLCQYIACSALALACAIPVAVAGAAEYVDLRELEPVIGDPAAGEQASTVCAACHGADGIAVVPTFPSIAGQPAGYLAVQMQAYAAGWREDPVMQGQAAALSAADIANLSAYYAAKTPAPAGEPDLDSNGASLYQSGDPARGIPGCQGCHGPAGAGPRPDTADTAPQPAWHTWPAVAGLPPDYVAKRLREYRGDSGLASSNTRIMHSVTANLTDEDIAALAAYIGSL